ncbi:MAG: flavin reductase family protein [Pigmentiphaga sp.]
MLSDTTRTHPLIPGEPLSVDRQTFDSRELRDVLGQFITGVTIVTTVDTNGKPQGLTANSFSSVSLDPPLVLWSQSRAAPSHRAFSSCEHFAIHILANDQIQLSNRFAQSGDKFAGLPLTKGIGGVPLLDGCAARLECRHVTNHPGGDHLVFIGHIERIQKDSRPPLAFGGGRYLAVLPHDAQAAVSRLDEKHGVKA